MSIGDWNTDRWVTVFAEVGEQLLNKSSREVGEALEFNKEEAEQIFTSVRLNSYIFKLRTKIASFAGESREETVAVDIKPIFHKEYNTHLIKNIQQMKKIGRK